MARSKRGRHGRKEWNRADERNREGSSNDEMTNDRFFTYYKAQNLIPEEEWDDFVMSLKRPLPTTFRIAGSRQTAAALVATIKDVHIPNLRDVVIQGQKIPPISQIPWYPEGLAWQLNVPKGMLRKAPEFQNFRSFLVFETEVGNLSRQEAVSMLPPLFLEVKPHHRVIDMCAAPGSKTAQLLEALHSGASENHGSTPTGLLIANDSDNKRTHLLIHQSARLPSPAFMVTNLDASIYPVIMIPAESPGCKNKLQQLYFDRILCDVPCSGDGTIRKNLGIWKHWEPMDGNGLHSLQVRILQRAFKLLKENGRIVYSTCSLNPVENEAVIAVALKSNSDFQLVDISVQYPDLKRRPGLTSWRPSIDRSVDTIYATYEEFSQSKEAKENQKMTEGHWPPQDVESYNLPRCMRIYPHQQDTGGFFIAVLEKKLKVDVESSGTKRSQDDPFDILESKKPRISWEDESYDKCTEATPRVMDIPMAVGEAETSPTPKYGVEKSQKKGRGGDDNSFKEQPFIFLSPDNPTLRNSIERLSLTNGFPISNVLVRNSDGGAARFMYLVNDQVKAIIKNNDFARIRLTASGTKFLAKQDGGKGVEAQFRFLNEGLPAILPFVDPSTFISADLLSLRTLIESNYPLIMSFHAPFKDVIGDCVAGSHVVRFIPGEEEDVVRLSHEIVLPLWKSQVSLTLMMDKKTKSALSMRLFGTDISPASRGAPLKIPSSAAVNNNIGGNDDGSTG